MAAWLLKSVDGGACAGQGTSLRPRQAPEEEGHGEGKGPRVGWSSWG